MTVRRSSVYGVRRSIRRNPLRTADWMSGVCQPNSSPRIWRGSPMARPVWVAPSDSSTMA